MSEYRAAQGAACLDDEAAAAYMAVCREHRCLSCTITAPVVAALTSPDTMDEYMSRGLLRRACFSNYSSCILAATAGRGSPSMYAPTQRHVLVYLFEIH